MNRLISAMPSSMCWPFGENSQLKVEAMRSLLNVSAIFSRANRPRRFTHGPRLVETVTSGDVVTMRCAKSESPRPSSFSSAPKPELRRHRRLDRDRKLAGTSTARRNDAGAAPSSRTARGRGTPAIRSAGVDSPSNLSHSWPGRTCIASRSCLHLRRRHQAGVIVLVARERQPGALDGVADEAGRPVIGRGLAERLDHRRQIVPAEIAHQPRELLVGTLLDQPGNRALIAELVREALAPRGAALEHQRRIELVRAVVDPFAQGFAARLAGTRPPAASRT